MDALSPFQDEEEVPDKNSTRCGGSILLSLTRWFQANNEMEMKKKKWNEQCWNTLLVTKV